MSFFSYFGSLQLLTYYQACNTFYHQGYDLCRDYEDFFKGLSNDVSNQVNK